VKRPFAGRGIEQPQRDAFDGVALTYRSIAIELAKAIEQRLDV
jgi:hypothetical protein